MRRSSWTTAILVVLLLGLLCLIVAYRVNLCGGRQKETIVHEIRHMIATLQTPLEATPGAAGEPGRSLRVRIPPGAAGLAAFLALAWGLRAAAQQRSRRRRS
jgi:hypothetical protein